MGLSLTGTSPWRTTGPSCGVSPPLTFLGSGILAAKYWGWSSASKTPMYVHGWYWRPVQSSGRSASAVLPPLPGQRCASSPTTRSYPLLSHGINGTRPSRLCLLSPSIPLSPLRPHVSHPLEYFLAGSRPPPPLLLRRLSGRSADKWFVRSAPPRVVTFSRSQCPYGLARSRSVNPCVTEVPEAAEVIGDVQTGMFFYLTKDATRGHNARRQQLAGVTN